MGRFTSRMLQTLFVFRRVSRRPTTGSGRVMIDAIANSPAKPILHTVRIQHLSCHLSEARWLKRRLAQGLCILALSTTSALHGDLRAGRVEGSLVGGPQRDSVGVGGGRGDSAMPRGRGPDPGPRGGGGLAEFTLPSGGKGVGIARGLEGTGASHLRHAHVHCGEGHQGWGRASIAVGRQEVVGENGRGLVQINISYPGPGNRPGALETAPGAGPGGRAKGPEPR